MFAELHIERGRVRAVLPCVTGTIIRTETSTYEFPGCEVFPGFVDNHAHITGLGFRRASVSLHTATSAEECAQRIAQASATQGGWIRASGWNQENWKNTSLPSASLLDAVVADTPVIATRVDGHAMWCNTAALKAAGLSNTGTPVGYLLDTEMDPMWAALPKPSEQELQTLILDAASACSAVGITEVHDMDVDSTWNNVMRSLAESGKLPIRVQSFLKAHNNEWQKEGLLPAGGELHRQVGVKMYADGALGSHGAYLLAPYTDKPETSGIRLLTKHEIAERCFAAIEEGWWAVATHAIGDAAVREVLDAYELVRGSANGTDIILRIEHAQHVHPDDVERFAKLGVFACIQPQHCISDAVMATARLGKNRLSSAYRWKSLVDAGVKIGAGSDFPIEPPSPLAGIYAFTNRVPSGMHDGWYTDECISENEAFLAYTEWAHATADCDYRRGKLEIGYDADFVILDNNPKRVVATFVAGIQRYS